MRSISRRKFLATGSAMSLAGGLSFPNILRSQEPGKKLNIAAIGAGGKGSSDIELAGEGNNVVAICDVDRDTLAKALKKYNLPEDKGFTDFRKMLDTIKEIDGVTISTPDHTHYAAAMHAIALGKHVCVQKPLVNTLWESQQLHLAAKKKGIVTNMGNQGHTGEGIRVLKEWIDQGAIGKVKEIHVWTNRPIWPQGKEATFPKGKLPDTLDWESWQGPNPLIDYIEGVHTFGWRGHTVYGAGAMGDMGCHLMDGPFFACGLTAPTRVEVTKVVEMGELYWPKGSAVTCHYTKEGIPFHWYEGKDERDRRILPPPILELIAYGEAIRWEQRPKEWIWRPLDLKMIMSKGGGFLIVGEKGAIINLGDYCEAPALIGEKAHEAWVSSNPKQTLERATKPGNPQGEWTHAIKNSLVCGSNFDYSVPLTNLCLVGNLAMSMGQPIEWDPEKLEVKGHPEAAKFIKREYRKGWEYSADKI